jgi:N-formylglutamate amidohydrolase
MPLDDGDGDHAPYPEWLVLHVPHDARVIPPSARGQFVVSDAELNAELVRMTDHRTHDLFLAAPSSAANVVRADVSRLVVDVERFEDDHDEPMVARGMGVIYQLDSRQRPLRRALSESERNELLASHYRPHHHRLTEIVDRILSRHGRCVVLDCHSFPSVPLPYELVQAVDRPQICIGTDPHHTPPGLRDAFVHAFRAEGLTTAIDTPFSGGLVPASHHRSDLRVRAIMVEVNRSLYLEEETGEPLVSFEGTARRIRACCRRALADWTGD